MTFQPPQLDADTSIEYSMFWELWRDEKFFECHEVLEELWKRTQTSERWFYAGLINSAVAIYQHRRGNSYGACRQWWRAQVKLRAFAPQFCGVDIEELLRLVEDEIASSINAQTATQSAQQLALRHAIEQRMARDFPNSHQRARSGE